MSTLTLPAAADTVASDACHLTSVLCPANTGYPDAASLIADCGHPNWPGWQLLFVLLTGATITALLTDHDLIRPRARTSRPPVVRIWRGAGRGGKGF